MTNYVVAVCLSHNFKVIHAVFLGSIIFNLKGPFDLFVRMFGIELDTGKNSHATCIQKMISTWLLHVSINDCQI